MKIKYGGNKMSAKICEIIILSIYEIDIYRNNAKNMQLYLHRPVPYIQLYPIIQK